MRRPGTIICALFFWVTAKSQQPLLYFKQLTQANGLSNNKVNCILQDKRGFIWIGTDDGLNRYDGNNFLIFKNIPGQKTSVSGNTITDLHEDKNGVLWIATGDGGISRYDYRLRPEDQFRQYKHLPGDSNSIPVNIVNALQEDEQGNLWLATSGAAVLRFDKQKEKFERLRDVGDLTMNDMCFDKEGKLWAGREGGSIMKVDPVALTTQMDPRYVNFYADLPHVVVTRFFTDSKKNIWFGSWDKAVYRYNALTGMEESFVNRKNDQLSFGEDEAIAFNEDRQGRIWIGGKYFGLYIYDPSANRFYNYRHDASKEGTLSNNTVKCIYIDKAGTVWIGTNSGISIHHAPQQQFEQHFLPAADPLRGPVVIYDFLKQDNGDLWIGTNNGIYTRSADGNFQHRKISYKGEDLAVTLFFKDIDGATYLGTDYTLLKYDERTGKAEALPNTDKDQVMSKLVKSRIVSVARDTIEGHPVLFTAPYGHFFTYYDLQEQQWVSRRDSVKRIISRYSIRDNLIRKFVRTKDGKLWLANAKNGLILLHKNTGGNTTFMNNPGANNSISNNNVYDIREDESGNLWVSTYGGGLNYFDTRKREFRHFASVNNLFEGLQTDKYGNVWSISNGNLQKFDPVAKTFAYVELPDIEKTGGVKGYIYKDRESKMYVAGMGYFISFDPDKVQVQQRQPEVFLTDFSIFDHSFSHLLMEKQISLSYKQNFFTIHFSAPFYSAPAPVQYSYMLEGVDKDWINAGSSTDAPYTNLNDGEYTFKVRATATPGTWSSKVTTMKIHIVPPFWKRWWFFLLAALFIAWVVYAIYSYRINEFLKRQAIRNKIAQDLHDNVGSTLSSISVYSQVAKIYKEKNRQEDLQHAIEKISSTASEMISEMNDIVWAINPRNDNMSVIIQRMESYAKPLVSTQGINYTFSYNPDIEKLHLPMESRKNFYLIFKEAVNNAVKYSGAKNLVVNIEYRHHSIILLVRDDGRGFARTEVENKAAASLSGNGLRNMEMRAKEMKGKMTITSEPGKGTQVELVFPPG